MYPLVTSTAQILALVDPNDPERPLARNWNQVRTQSGSGQTTYEAPKTHRARDIYLEPGSKVYTPVSGIFDGWVPSNEDKSLSMGWIAKIIGVDGNYWRFVHIAVSGKNDSLIKGFPILAGTLLGTTSFHKLGDSDSHLHLDVTPGRSYNADRRIDPISALGVDGWNRMVNGFASPQEQATRAAETATAKTVASILIGSAAAAAAFVVFRRLFDRGLHS